MSLLVVVAATVAFAAAIQSTMGFGFALVAVPIIAVAEDPRVAVVAVTAIGVPMTLWNTIRWRADLQVRPMVMVVGASLVGMPVGALILARAPDRALTFAIGVVVLVLTAWLWRGLRLPPGPRTEIAAGIASGALATSTGTNGPPLVIAFQATGMERDAFRATLACCFLAQGVVALAFFWVRTRVLSGSLLGTFVAEAMVGLTMWERVLTMLAVVPEWFRLLLWPAQLKADYGPGELVGHTVWGPMQTLGVLLLVSATALAAAAWRRAPVVAFGLVWCAVGLFPVHNVLAPTGILLAERTLFLPSIGAMIALGGIAAWVLDRVGGSVARLVAVTGAVLTAVGIYRSNVRHQVWSDQFTLWYHTANVDAPKSFRAHEALAETYFDIGVERMAEREYRLAIQYAPRTLTRPTLEYAERLRSRGFCFRASELYRKVLEVHPEHLPARASLIACLLDLGYYDQAVYQARMGVTFDWERSAFQLALATADSARRVHAPPGTVRVAVPSGFNTRSHMMIFDKK